MAAAPCKPAIAHLEAAEGESSAVWGTPGGFNAVKFLLAFYPLLFFLGGEHCRLVGCKVSPFRQEQRLHGKEEMAHRILLHDFHCTTFPCLIMIFSKSLHLTCFHMDLEWLIYVYLT